MNNSEEIFTPSSFEGFNLTFGEEDFNLTSSQYYINPTPLPHDPDYPDFDPSAPKFAYSFEYQLIISIMFNLVFLGSLLGNLLVVIVVIVSPRMRTVTNFLITSLAIGDLVQAIMCTPFGYVVILLQMWPFGEVLCQILPPAQAISVFVSAYTLVALALDRYMAILYPLKPRLRKSQAGVVIALVWIVAFLTAIPIILTQNLMTNPENNNTFCIEIWENESYKAVYSFTLMILQYFFPLGILIFTYTRIALAVWGKQAPGEAEHQRDERRVKQRNKMIKMMVTVVIVYAFCWLPLNFLNVLGDIYDDIWLWDHMPYVFPIILWISQSSSLTNALIISWLSKEFRRGFCTIFHRIFCLRRLKRRRTDSPTDFPQSIRAPPTPGMVYSTFRTSPGNINCNGRTQTRTVYSPNSNSPSRSRSPYASNQSLNHNRINGGNPRSLVVRYSPEGDGQGRSRSTVETSFIQMESNGENGKKFLMPKQFL